READSPAVDLELAVVAGAAHLLAGEPDDALLPRRQLVFVERVAQGQHRHEVLVLGELALHLRPDALRWRVGRAERRVLLLELPQLPHETVVLGIRTCR